MCNRADYWINEYHISRKAMHDLSFRLALEAGEANPRGQAWFRRRAYEAIARLRAGFQPWQ